MITFHYGTITPFWDNYLANYGLQVMPDTAMVCVTDMTDTTVDGVNKLTKILDDMGVAKSDRHTTERSVVAVLPLEQVALIKLAWPPT